MLDLLTMADTQIIAADHRDRITTMHMKNNIDITKKTHAGCHYAAQTARAHGASVNGTKALGGWSDNGSFNPVYGHAFPLDALLGAGMFNARRPEDYTLPRNSIGESTPRAYTAPSNV
jgi:hypothetical protein